MLSKRFSKIAPVFAGAVAAGLGATNALAALTMDLRVTAVTGSTGATISIDRKTVTAGTSGNVTVTMAVWAQVTGNGPGADDVQLVSGSFLSSLGGMLGNLAVTNIPTLFQALSSSNGLNQDLDGDGDLDVGNNNNFDADNFFRARSGKMVGTQSNFDGSSPGLTFNSITNGTEYRVALLRFTQTSGAGDGSKSTDVNFRGWNVAEGAVWGEDQEENAVTDTDSGETTSYNYENGTVLNPALGVLTGGVAVHIQATGGGGITPEPASLGLLGVAGLGLLSRRKK